MPFSAATTDTGASQMSIVLHSTSAEYKVVDSCTDLLTMPVHTEMQKKQSMMLTLT